MTKLNQICDQKTVWLPLNDWDLCRNHPKIVDKSRVPCCCGVDLSTSQDCTAAVFTHFHKDVLYIEPHFFIPRENIHERERLHKVPYSVWAADPKNNLWLTDGDSIDYDFVTNKILERSKALRVETYYYDRYKWSSCILQLAKHGCDCVAHGQDFGAMNAACHEFERLTLTHNIDCDNPIFRWMISHAEIKTDEGGRIRVVKPTHASPKKVDGIVAAIMTLTHHTRLRAKVHNFVL